MKAGLKKRIDHLVGKAVHDWDMIRGNDKILVGVSGGLDSQVLLKILYDLKKKAPVRFEILPVHIDVGFDNFLGTRLKDCIDKDYCSLKLELVRENYGLLAHSDKNRENPCFLCSRLKRKKLFEIAEENGCAKIALGHHKDDLIETLFLNIFYAGKIGTMKPRQSFFNGVFDIIRPLAYVEKKDISLFAEKFGLPEFATPCPSAGKTKRSQVRKMLEGLYSHNEHIKGNIFRAMSNVAADYLLGAENDRYPEPT